MPENVTDEDILNLKKAGYSEKAIGYYLNQTNLGAIEYPDIKHIQIGTCGDVMFLYINLYDGPNIQEIKFKYIGCPALAASGSSMTELVKGRTMLEASEITEKDIMNDLESLPDDHLHCPVLAIQTLRGALDVLENKKLLSKDEHDDYIHPCGLTGKQVDELSPLRCDDCDMLKECEEDHIILRKMNK
jgi:NifU-like protein involved in Fe-S cluster formation